MATLCAVVVHVTPWVAAAAACGVLTVVVVVSVVVTVLLKVQFSVIDVVVGDGGSVVATADLWRLTAN